MPIESEAGMRAMTRDDARALAKAVNLLEHTSLAARLSNALGRQIELVRTILPEPMRALVSHAALSALEAALVTALASLEQGQRPASPRLHKALGAASGALGGAFGLALLPIELPISTTVMLRSIADVGREQGEDLTRPEAALACLQVFAFGGRTHGDAYVQGGYFAVRGLLAESVSEATRYLLERGTAEEAAPALVRLIGQIAARFGVAVSEKVAAQAVPVLGALGAAGVNTLFIGHFQSLARGHFIVRRLERTYGAEAVRGEYENWRAAEAGA